MEWLLLKPNSQCTIDLRRWRWTCTRTATSHAFLCLAHSKCRVGEEPLARERHESREWLLHVWLAGALPSVRGLTIEYCALNWWRGKDISRQVCAWSDWLNVYLYIYFLGWVAESHNWDSKTTVCLPHPQNLPFVLVDCKWQQQRLTYFFWTPGKCKHTVHFLF